MFGVLSILTINKVMLNQSVALRTACSAYDLAFDQSGLVTNKQKRGTRQLTELVNVNFKQVDLKCY